MSIDWSKPLELADGTPVRLEAHDTSLDPCLTNGPDGTPDSEGGYWVEREDGLPIRGEYMYSFCVSADEGDSGFPKCPWVRNRD